MKVLPKIRTAPEHPVFAAKTYAQIDQERRLPNQLKKAVPYLGGFRLTPKQLIPVFSPQEMHVAPVRFYQVQGERWSPDPTVAISSFPFRLDHKDGDIVPIAGGIYVGQKKLSDAQMEQLGLKVMRDDKGKKITFPYFCSYGARVLMDMQIRSLPIFAKAVDLGKSYFIGNWSDFPFLPTSLADLKPYSSATGLDKAGFVEGIQRILQTSWEQMASDVPQVDLATYFQRRKQSGFAKYLVNLLVKKQMAAHWISSCLQFKGAGAHYIGRLEYFAKDGSISLREGEAILSSQRTITKSYQNLFCLVGYPHLVGSFGLFLDQIHQPPPASPDPVGGMLMHDTNAIGLDRLLLECGAGMAGLSISAIRLLKQETIRQVLGLDHQSGDLYILARAAGEDTRRLKMLGIPELYKLYISETHEDFNAGREKHLLQLAENIGKNIQAVLCCKLTVKDVSLRIKEATPNTDNNLNPIGEMFDTTELIPAKDIEQIKDLMFLWLNDLFDVVEASGLSIRDFLTTDKYLIALLRGVFGTDSFKASKGLDKKLLGLSKKEIIAILLLRLFEDWQKKFERQA